MSSNRQGEGFRNRQDSYNDFRNPPDRKNFNSNMNNSSNINQSFKLNLNTWGAVNSSLKSSRNFGQNNNNFSNNIQPTDRSTQQNSNNVNSYHQDFSRNGQERSYNNNNNNNNGFNRSQYYDHPNNSQYGNQWQENGNGNRQYRNERDNNNNWNARNERSERDDWSNSNNWNSRNERDERRYRSHHHDNEYDQNYNTYSNKSSSVNSASISPSSSNLYKHNSTPQQSSSPRSIPAPPKPPSHHSPPPQLPDFISSDDEIDNTRFEYVKPSSKNNNPNSSLVTPQEEIKISSSDAIQSSLLKLKEKANANQHPEENNNANKNAEIILKSKPKKKMFISQSSSLGNEIKNKNSITPFSEKKTQKESDISSSFIDKELRKEKESTNKNKDIIKNDKESKKESIFDSLNQEFAEWIQSNLEDVNNMKSADQKSSEKLNQNNELDLNSFIHEFDFDVVLRRRDWQKKPESLIRKMSSSEFDFRSNSDAIENLIVKDIDDPFFYNSNPFTLEIVTTEEEKITYLFKKYNLPDIHKYIDDQKAKNEEEEQKSINNLSNLKEKRY